jgi:hypothetical protein
VKEKGDIAELAGNSLDNIILYQFPTFLSRYLTASRSHFLEKKCYKGKRKQGSKSGCQKGSKGKNSGLGARAMQAGLGREGA